MISKKEPKGPTDSAFAGMPGAAQPPVKTAKKPAPSKSSEGTKKGKDG